MLQTIRKCGDKKPLLAGWNGHRERDQDTMQEADRHSAVEKVAAAYLLQTYERLKAGLA